MKGLNNLSICVLICFVGVAVYAQTRIIKPSCSTQGEELWPHSNPDHFWYCHHAGADPIDLPCPAGRGFLRTTDLHGCVPYENWKCKQNIRVPTCSTIEEYMKPHRHADPKKFYACPEPRGTPPVVLTCRDQNIEGTSGTSVNRVFVDNKENMGCVPYEDWYCNQHGGDRE